MKLFLPTTSLNFIDILATESISPKSYYMQRIFGTKRNFTTEYAINEDFLILFRKIPMFDLLENQDSNYEEYPLVLELELDEYDIQKIGDEIYLLNRTIYFDLDTIKLLFFKEEHLQRVVQQSKLVTEVKNVAKYVNNFEIIDNFDELYKIDMPLNIPFSVYPIELELEFDKIFNSVKGFLYGYLFVNRFQMNSNLILIEEMGFKINELIETSLQLTGEAKVICDMFGYTKDQMKKQYLREKNLKVNVEVDKIFEFNLNSILLKDELSLRNNDVEKELFEQILIYLIMNSKQKVGQLEKNEQVELINVITDIVKLKNLDESYMNDIRLIRERCIENNFEIDVLNIKSIVLQNFYALILKYNNLDELTIFLKEKEIDKQFILYSFMGAFIGYSGLERRYTEKLLKIENINFLKEIDNFLNKIRKDIRYSLFKIDEKKEENPVERQLPFGVCRNQTADEENLKKKNCKPGLYKQLREIKKDGFLKRLNSKSYCSPKGVTVACKKIEGNIRINLEYKGQSFELLLIYRDNVDVELLNNYKNYLKSLEVDTGFTLGNYPMIKLENVKDELLLLECLFLLQEGI